MTLAPAWANDFKNPIFVSYKEKCIITLNPGCAFTKLSFITYEWAK
jgi:hypothetical protein